MDDPDRKQEFFACLALKHTPGLGCKTIRKIMDAYPSAGAAVSDARSWPERKVANKPASAACAKGAWRQTAEDEYRRVLERGFGVLLWSDPEYPALLRAIPDPPLVLYYAGDPSLLANPGLAVVGSRQCTRRGLAAARAISHGLSSMGLTVVSGLALGIDRQAHQGGLEGPGSSVAVLGCGLDIDYPAGNADVRKALEARGLVLTEYGPGVRPSATHFPHRNRIISGLCLGVLVAEAASRSGSLITARLAGEQGREVFALAGGGDGDTFEGCRSLLEDGAVPVESAEDVVRELREPLARSLKGEPVLPAPRARDANPLLRLPDLEPEVPLPVFTPPQSEPEPEPAPAPDLDGDDLDLWRELAQRERPHLDELARALDWDSPRTSRVLLGLEIRGLVRQLPGMRYEPVLT